eukprot:3395871-Pyramimonas_sp.AAC.1
MKPHVDIHPHRLTAPHQDQEEDIWIPTDAFGKLPKFIDITEAKLNCTNGAKDLDHANQQR